MFVPSQMSNCDVKVFDNVLIFTHSSVQGLCNMNRFPRKSHHATIVRLEPQSYILARNPNYLSCILLKFCFIPNVFNFTVRFISNRCISVSVPSEMSFIYKEMTGAQSDILPLTTSRYCQKHRKTSIHFKILGHMLLMKFTLQKPGGSKASRPISNVSTCRPLSKNFSSILYYRGFKAIPYPQSMLPIMQKFMLL